MAEIEISKGGHHRTVCDGTQHWCITDKDKRTLDGPCLGIADSRHRNSAPRGGQVILGDRYAS